MRKFITAVLMVGSLVMIAVPVMAQDGGESAVALQGGIADPNTLASFGVVLPYSTSTALGAIALIQVASPVEQNLDAHMFFYQANCLRVGPSVGIPLTKNDIAFQAVNDIVPSGTDGLIALAKADASGFTLIPLDNPVHARVYEFNSNTGRSTVLAPIIVNAAEFVSVAHWYSPLRTGATFFAPLQSQSVATDLILICPLSTIVGAPGAAFGQDPGGNGEIDFTNTLFPQINPRLPAFPAPSNNIRVRVYNVNEFFKRDFTISCTCFTPFIAIANSVSPFYGIGQPGEALDGTYTELTSVPPTVTGLPVNSGPRTSFTGYTTSYTVGSGSNAFFAPLQSGSQLSIDGPAVVTER